MAVETLAAFRAADKGMNVQPVILVGKGTDGEIYLAEVDPATGAIVVAATLDKTGLATEAKQDDGNTILGNIKTKTDNLDVALSTRASEATLEKLRAWPYAPWDTKTLTEGALTDTWQYLNGAVPVGNFVITYTDATKNTIANIVFSPAKAV